MSIELVKPVMCINEYGWALRFGAWDDPERFQLDGFDSPFDAWAFCIAHGLDDPSAGVPAQFRKYQVRPPSPPLQPSLLEEAQP